MTSDFCGHEERKQAKFTEKHFRMTISCNQQGYLITSENIKRGVDESFFFNAFPEKYQL